MWTQIKVIVWAQWRTVRNHMPRLGMTSILGNILNCVWHALVLSAAISLAYGLPLFPAESVVRSLPPVLLAVCLIWQLLPLFTLSAGWSLQLKKIQIYPVQTDALFGIELLLRITATPELILIVLGGTIGLLRHSGLPAITPAFVLLFVVFNLLLSLAIREFVLHSFERNRFREIFAILLVSIAILPQLLLRNGQYERAGYLLERFGSLPFTPWTVTAQLMLARAHLSGTLAFVLYLVAAFLLARFSFTRSLRMEDSPQSRPASTESTRAVSSERSTTLDRLLPDPMAALVQKEIQCLLRMPRFRVAFGMACVFSVLLLLPLVTGPDHHEGFLSRNSLPFVSIYGLLILSESLILNIFGTDRSAASLYLLAPVPLKTVIRSKNVTAVLFIAAQSCLAMFGASFLREGTSFNDVFAAFALVAVLAFFFLCVGNYTSVVNPRPSDPRQTMRKAAGGKLQLWLLLCTVGMFVLGALAFLAEWAIGSRWALYAVLGIEFAVSLVFYHVALDSATRRALSNTESFIDALSRGPAVIGAND